MYLTNSVMNILTQHFTQKKLEFMHSKEQGNLDLHEESVFQFVSLKKSLR